MKSSKAMPNELVRLTKVSHRQLSLNTRIACLCLQDNKLPKAVEVILLFLEYLQLIAQALYIRSSSTPSTQDYRQSFSRSIMYAVKLVNPAYTLDYKTGNGFIITVLGATLAFTLAKYLIFGYLAFTYSAKTQTSSKILKIWHLIFKSQNRVLYFFITSFWVIAIEGVMADAFDPLGIGRIGNIALFSALMIVEFLFSISLNGRYYQVLPTKSFLSSKDSKLELFTLAQKSIKQAIQITLNLGGLASSWIFALLNLFCSLARVYHYFRILPLYNLKALLLQGLLLMTVFAMDISILLNVIVRSFDQVYNSENLVMIWIFLSILLMKICHAYLSRTTLRLVTQTFRGPSSLLIHKIEAIRQFRKSLRFAGEFSDKNSNSSLIYLTINTNIKDALNIDQENMKNIETNLSSKDASNRMFMSFLENLLAQNPRNNLIKLYIAELYAKKLKLYGLAMKYLTDLKHSHNSVIALNATLLVWNIQQQLRKESIKQEDGINLSVFFTSQLTFAEVKEIMLKQNNNQIDLCRELITDVPDLAKIFKFAQNVSECRSKIDRKISLMNQTMPDYFVQPLILYANYHAMLNYSYTNHTRYNKLYLQKYTRYERFFKSEDLIPENYYQENTAFVIFSGRKEDLGKIVYCTNSIGKIYGGDANLYTEANVSLITPPNFQNLYASFFESKLEAKEKNQLNRTFRGYSYHKEGYLLELDFHFDVFPFLTQGFYFYLIIRPVQRGNEYIIVKENGDIEGATKGISEQLHLNRSSKGLAKVQQPNIEQISRELKYINEAFNCKFYNKQKMDQKSEIFNDEKANVNLLSLIRDKSVQSSYQESKVNIDIEQANELYLQFTTEGRSIELQPIYHKEHKGSTDIEDKALLTYHCKIEVLKQDLNANKLIILEESRKGAPYSKLVDKENHIVKSDLFENNLLKTVSKEDRAIETQIVSENNDSENLNEIELINEKLPASIASDILAPRKHYKIENLVTDFKTQFKTQDQGDFQTMEGLLSPVSHGGAPLSPTAPLLTGSPRNELKSLKQALNFVQKCHKIKEEKQAIEDERKLEMHDRASQWSKASRVNRSEGSFDSALKTKYYSKPLKLLFIAFYVLMLGVLGGQICLKMTLDETVKTLRLQKELLRNSQLRDFQLVGIHRTSRFVWDLATGALKASWLGAFAATTTANTYISVTNISIVNLTDVNQEIMGNAGSLDEAARDNLFKKDVRVYQVDSSGVQQYMNMTNFQAAEQIVQIGLKGLSLVKTNIAKSKYAFDFIFRNALNDLLLKSEDTSAHILDDIEDKIQKRTQIIMISLILSILALVIMIMALIWSLIRSYTKENTNMLALLKLDSKQIKNLCGRLEYFKMNLESGTINFEEKTNFKISEYSKKDTQYTHTKKRSNKKASASPNSKGLISKYLLYIGKTILCLLVLVFLVAYNSVLATNSIHFLHDEQSKLYFADRMATRTNFAFLATQELFASNGSTMLRNEPILLQLQKSIDDVALLRTKVLQVFLDEDANYDPLIKSVMFDNTCALVGTGSLSFCNILTSKGRKSSLITMLSEYESLMTDKYQQYLISDRTEASLRAIQTDRFDVMLPLQRIIADGSTLISQRINTIFQTKFKEVKTQGNMTFVVFCVIIVLIAGLIWVFIFRQVRENVNQFKTVLQALPRHLVLSSFILKMFVIHTSNGLLDANSRDL